MSPVADNQVIVPDRDLEEEKTPSESEPPRIRCPLLRLVSPQAISKNVTLAAASLPPDPRLPSRRGVE